MLLAGAAGLWPMSREAQAQTASTAATSYREAGGRSWIYITWNSDQPEFLQRAVVALYRKESSPEAAGNYELVSVVSRAPDAAVIRAALQRAKHLGQDLVAVDSLVQSSFAELAPSAAMPLEEKIRVILISAQTRAETDRTLQFLARSQPAIAAAAGQAYIAEVTTGGPVTFELRVCDHTPKDPATECTTVMGRVTVIGGTATPLPPPGNPVDVSWKGMRGDLNVRLIWETPDALRAESLLQAGFHVYRVTPAFYASHFGTRSPLPDELAFLSQADPASVNRVTRQPVYPEVQLNGAQVLTYQSRRAASDGHDDAPGADPLPFFAVDDNHRFEPGGRPFRDGDQFYYYVVARDLLGREGLASTNTLITLCRRRAPEIPREVKLEVFSNYDPPTGASNQYFKLRWVRNPTNQSSVPTDAYRLYRWDSPQEVVKPRIPPMPHIKEIPADDLHQSLYEALDDTPTRPRLPDADQITYWYTLRAVRRAPCGDELLSGHSPPVPGVLRNWTGPGRPSGDIALFCARPQVQFVSAANQTLDNPHPRTQELELICDRPPADHLTAWVEYYLAALDLPDPAGLGLSGDRLLGRVWFSSGEPKTTFLAQIPRSGVKIVRVRCRVGSWQGEVSDVADGRIAAPGDWPKVRMNFATLPVTGQLTSLGGCQRHTTRNPETGRLEPVGLTLHYADTGREHRIYASIDDGPLDLVAHGTNFPSAAEFFPFTGFPANGSRICFYGQNLDSQGLKGPMLAMGCIQVLGSQPMPIPALSKPQGALAPGGAQAVALLKWFYPPHAAERFRVLVGVENPALLPSRISARLYSTASTAVETVGGRDFRVYETGRVGANFGTPEDPNFTVAIEVQPGQHYAFRVQAVSAVGELSGQSDPAEFEWSLAPAPGAPTISWPARTPPVPAESVASARAAARRMAKDAGPSIADWLQPEAWTDASARLHVGVCIGETPIAATAVLGFDPNSGAPYLAGSVMPEDLLGLLRAEGPTLRRPVLPCVLYRHQIANTAFPEVGGDVVQVSPLVQAIARRVTAASGSVRTEFLDPFIDLRAVDTPAGPVLRVYLKDTQPAVQEASYRYVLVKFTNFGEVDSATHTPTVTIPIP